MTIKLRGNTWHIDVTINGQKLRQSLKTGDKREAAKRAKALEDALWAGQVLPKSMQRGMTLKEAFDELYVSHWAATKDKNGVCARFVLLTRFIPCGTEVSTIDQCAVDDLITAMSKASYTKSDEGQPQKYSPATINRVLSLLHFILSRMHRKGLIKSVPYLDRKQETKRTRYVSEAEEGALWSALLKSGNPNHIRCLRLFHFLTDTGCRMGEAIKLQWSDVDLANRFIVLRDTKASSDVGKPLTLRAFTALSQEHSEGFGKPFEGIGETMYRNAWEYAKKEAGLGNDKALVRHSLRHTTASRLVQGGVDLKRVQEFLGHKSYLTTLRYAHLSREQLRGAVGVLEGVSKVCAGTSDLHEDEQSGNIEVSQVINHLPNSSIAQLVERRTVNPYDNSSLSVENQVVSK